MFHITVNLIVLNWIILGNEDNSEQKKEGIRKRWQFQTVMNISKNKTENRGGIMSWFNDAMQLHQTIIVLMSETKW